MTSTQRDRAFDRFYKNNQESLLSIWTSLDSDNNFKTFSWEVFNRYPQFHGNQKISSRVFHQLLRTYAWETR